MKTSQKGLALIQHFEGLRLTAYLCPAGVPTIGYGHIRTVKPQDVGKKTISKDQAVQFLRGDLSIAEKTVNSYVNVPLEQNQFDALVSFVFNCGTGAFKKSTLLRKLNIGGYDSVPAELNKWVHANKKPLPGLIRRRKAEGELWLMGTKEDNQATPQAVDNPTKPLTKSRTLAGLATAGAGEIIQQTAEQVNYAGDLLGSDAVRLIGVAITIAGLAFAAYARFDDYRKGKL